MGFRLDVLSESLKTHRKTDVGKVFLKIIQNINGIKKISGGEILQSGPEKRLQLQPSLTNNQIRVKVYGGGAGQIFYIALDEPEIIQLVMEEIKNKYFESTGVQAKISAAIIFNEEEEEMAELDQETQSENQKCHKMLEYAMGLFPPSEKKDMVGLIGNLLCVLYQGSSSEFDETYNNIMDLIAQQEQDERDFLQSLEKAEARFDELQEKFDLKPTVSEIPEDLLFMKNGFESVLAIINEDQRFEKKGLLFLIKALLEAIQGNGDICEVINKIFLAAQSTKAKTAEVRIADFLDSEITARERVLVNTREQSRKIAGKLDSLQNDCKYIESSIIDLDEQRSTISRNIELSRRNLTNKLNQGDKMEDLQLLISVISDEEKRLAEIDAKHSKLERKLAAEKEKLANILKYHTGMDENMRRQKEEIKTLEATKIIIFTPRELRDQLIETGIATKESPEQPEVNHVGLPKGLEKLSIYSFFRARGTSAVKLAQRGISPMEIFKAIYENHFGEFMAEFFREKALDKVVGNFLKDLRLLGLIDENNQIKFPELEKFTEKKISSKRTLKSVNVNGSDGMNEIFEDLKKISIWNIFPKRGTSAQKLQKNNIGLSEIMQALFEGKNKFIELFNLFFSRNPQSVAENFLKDAREVGIVDKDDKIITSALSVIVKRIIKNKARWGRKKQNK